MSEENKLRSQIREYVKSVIKEDIATLDKYLTKLKNKPTSTDFRK